VVVPIPYAYVVQHPSPQLAAAKKNPQVTDAVFFQTLEQAANLRFDQEACGSLQSLGGFHS